MKRIRKLLKTETSIDLKVKSRSRSRRFSLDPSLATKSATVAPINLPPPSSKSPVKRKTEIFLGLKPNMIFFFFTLQRNAAVTLSNSASNSKPGKKTLILLFCCCCKMRLFELISLFFEYYEFTVC